MATYKGHNEDSSGNLLLSIGNGMTATVETGSTASQAYTKGSYIFFNNRFCKATSAIASGATLAIGTNLSETSVGAELTSHLRSSDGKEFYFDVKDGTYGYYPSASKTASEFVPFGGTTAPTLLWTNPIWSDTNGFQGETNPNNYCMPTLTINGLSNYNYVIIQANNGYYSSPNRWFPFIIGVTEKSYIAAPTNSGSAFFVRSISISGDTISVGSNSDGWTCAIAKVWGM